MLRAFADVDGCQSSHPAFFFLSPVFPCAFISLSSKKPGTLVNEKLSFTQGLPGNLDQNHKFILSELI